MSEQWLSIVEYARAYNVSDMTVRRRIKTGKLHAVLKDGKYYIPTQRDGASAEQIDDIRPQTATAATVASQSTPPGMTVIKGHPTAHRTLSYETEMPVAPRPTAAMATPKAEIDPSSIIPQSLQAPILGQQTASVDASALLAYCEATVKRALDTERRTVERFRAKLETLEAVIARKDQENKQLSQQLEDMQLLVKILEKSEN